MAVETIYGDLADVYPKANLALDDVPANQKVTAGDWNVLCQGLFDLEAAAGGGGVPTTTVIGDMLYATDTGGTFGRRAGVATGNALISGGVGAAPTFGKVGLTTHVDGTLPVANGGTGLTSVGAIGALPYFSATNAMSSIAATAAGKVFVSAGTGVVPAWSTSLTLSGASIPTVSMTSNNADGFAYMEMYNNGTKLLQFIMYGSTHGTTNGTTFLGQSTNNLAVIKSNNLAKLCIGTADATSVYFGCNDAKLIQFDTGNKIGFFAVTPVVKPTGVAVDSAGIHAALVLLGLIAA